MATEEITEPEGLAALSLDALSSVAYGPQAMLIVLVTAGAGAYDYILPITVGIVILLAILVASYRQVIDAYPEGGGAYAVSKANLGSGASRLAGASLIVDYVLTVAVSIAAGVATLQSTFPALAPFTLPLCLAVLTIITVVNLRGVGEGARAFIVPTAVFVLGLFAVLGAGLLHLGASRAAALPLTLAPVGVFLLLKAFAAGSSALTGVEAIANGVPLFRSPKVRRAKTTEALLGGILGTMLLAMAVLAVHYHVAPNANETVLNQIMRHAVGSSWLYYLVALGVTTVLALAANTSFGGLPLLLSLLAHDGLVPHLFAQRGDRQVFQYGIGFLAIVAAVLLLVSDGNTNALVPLFAIGVFIGFTCAQSGMVVHWWRTRERHWHAHLAINAIGALLTGMATIVFAVTKFAEGAWIVVLAVPALILLFHRIHRYYAHASIAMGIGERPGPLTKSTTLVIVPITDISRITAQALSDATSFGSEVVAVMVIFDKEHGRRVRAEWDAWNPGVDLKLLQSQYRSVVRPVLRFVTSAEVTRRDRVVVLIPEVVADRWWQSLLHNQMGRILSSALRRNTDVVVAMMPVHLPTN